MTRAAALKRRRGGKLGGAVGLALVAALTGGAHAASAKKASPHAGAVRVEATAQGDLFPLWRRPVVRMGGDRRVIDSLGTPALVPASAARAPDGAIPALVVVGTSEGEVLAVEQESGALRWRYRHGAAIDGVVTLLSAADMGNGQGTAAKVAVVGSRDHKLVALTLDGGRPLWTTTLDGPSRAAVTARDRRLFVTTENNQVVALEAKTGKILWVAGRPPTTGLSVLGHGRPVVAGSRVVATFADGFVMAMDVHDGRVLWERPLSLQGGRFVDADADPVVVGDRVFVASVTDGIYALDLEAGHPVWTQPVAEVLSLVALGATPATGEPTRAKPNVDLVVAGDVYGKVRAFRQDDGQPYWQLDAGAGPATSLVPFLDGVAFLAGVHGVVWLDGETGKPRSVAALGGMPGGGLVAEGNTLAHLARGGALFLWQGHDHGPRGGQSKGPPSK